MGTRAQHITARVRARRVAPRSAIGEPHRTWQSGDESLNPLDDVGVPTASAFMFPRLRPSDRNADRGSVAAGNAGRAFAAEAVVSANPIRALPINGKRKLEAILG